MRLFQARAKIWESERNVSEEVALEATRLRNGAREEDLAAWWEDKTREVCFVIRWCACVRVNPFSHVGWFVTRFCSQPTSCLERRKHEVSSSNCGTCTLAKARRLSIVNLEETCR